MAILDQIEAIPAKQRILIVAVVAVALLGGFYQFVYKPKTLRIKVLDAQLTTLNSELQDLRAIKKKLEEFKSMVDMDEGNDNEEEMDEAKQAQMEGFMLVYELFRPLT